MFLDNIWLIPLFPLLGALLMLIFGRRLDPQSLSAEAHGNGDHGSHSESSFGHRVISLLCPGTVLIAFLFSLFAVIDLHGLEEPRQEVVLYTWLAGLKSAVASGGVASFTADWGFLLDPLSSVMVLIVTGIGFLIHVYSIGYMAHDGGYYRFFGYLNLFIFFMLTLVLANNYVLLFVGWEGVGLCSYLLIGFYFHRKSATDAATKAFLVNRIGDAAFVLGMLLTFTTLGTLQFTEIGPALEEGGFTAETTAFGVLSWITLFFFIGATGKSAQLPLYVWLPDAMEGPTPVSALIHAATMVTAGVYMVARSSEIYILAPKTMLIVAVVGAATAIFAATIALVQNDIKRVLAYSTVSQLGYMFLACGVGAFWVGVFHLYTHAFFKALLFLGSGSVIHAVGGEQDMRKMGGLRDKIPVTYRTMWIGAIAIAGIPGLAGFFSKDEILWKTFSSHGGDFQLLWVLGFITAGMTAFYMFRLMYMTFYGVSRVDPNVHVHESPRTMTVPLVVLAVGSVLAGWVGTPVVFGPIHEMLPNLEHWLGFSIASAAYGHGEAAHHNATIEWLLMACSVGLAIGGILFARKMFNRKVEGDPMQRMLRSLHPVLTNKYYVDEVYNATFVDGLAKGGGQKLSDFDRTVVDGGVNGTALLTRWISGLSIWWDTWIVDGTVRLTGFLVKFVSYPTRMLQTGFVQNYAFVVVLGVIVILSYYIWR
ncbi:MAG: NADH-quinone oxidoreductase subunit L [Solibacterales bacterium]|nr:NADH-quinone oxidoreductase subunit L [Bryobacterales bacterium]|tara:strand:- start:8021 stop:10138 length:2118 start_codon:yes stop_codon:yes gene_type:complete